VNSQNDHNEHGVDYSEDLARRLRDPEFAAEYREARKRASLGLKIAKLRSAQGLSQAELAARLNTTQSVISRYESADYSSYRLDTLRRLAEALGSELVVDIGPTETARK
jgi:ribosome-binding protein aMBF1 (putative translation factor)